MLHYTSKFWSKLCLPFLKDVYPDGHRLMADNDPKHTSRAAQDFLKDNEVFWWRTPSESPDCNPIENLWKKNSIEEKSRPQLSSSLLMAFMHFGTL